MSIPLSSNFNLVTQLPLDARYAQADTTARDAIPSIQRHEGLLVYTVSDQTLWQLQGGITNADWVAIGTGAPGSDGRSILNGSGAPGPGTGLDGDFYIDTDVWDIYGPKTAGAWGSPTSLIGPPGADGADGADGTNGLSILNGSGPPGPGTGVDGEYYIDNLTYDFYGPKTAGTWPAPVNLIGPAGPSIDIEWEGVAVSGPVSKINLKGTGVSDVSEVAPGEVEVTISGGGNAVDPDAPEVFGECDTPLDIPATGLRVSDGHMSQDAMNQVVFIQGDSGPIDITATPQIESHNFIGALLTIVGRSNTNTVTLQNGTGLVLNGIAVLGLANAIEFIWMGSYWLERRRNF